MWFVRLMIRHLNVSRNVERRLLGYGRSALTVLNYIWFINDEGIFLQVISAGAKTKYSNYRRG